MRWSGARPAQVGLGDAYKTAGDLLATALPRRWAHSQGVCFRAGEIGPHVAIENLALLVRAAILHDVGYSPSIAWTGFHALDGARYLHSKGFDERLVGLVAHHSCARIEAAIRDLGDELDEFGQAPPDLVDALIFCDMTVSPVGRRVSVDDRIAEVLARYGPDSLVGRFMQRAAPELRAATYRVAARLDASCPSENQRSPDVGGVADRIQGVVDSEAHRRVEVEA